MSLGFSGAVADFYERYRRGYPAETFDALGEAFGLTADDVVVDLGCGTGMLALPMAARVRAVVGVDPEPDMLVRARDSALRQGVANAAWMIGADSDMATLKPLLGQVGAVMIGRALHWMDHETLFPVLHTLVRPGGGVAVITNGTPIWLQASAWSRALKDFLEQWLGTDLVLTCGADEESQRRYREALEAAGFATSVITHTYADEVTLDWITGNIYSALSEDKLPDQREEFAERVARALEPHTPFVDEVTVTHLIGERRSDTAPNGPTGQ
jgi:trans-aconitate methyltransferase